MLQTKTRHRPKLEAFCVARKFGMSPTPDVNTLLEVAIDAARAGGQHALRNRARSGEVHQSLPYDVKLQLDLECQARVGDIIRERFPKHAILGEEDASAVAALSGHGGPHSETAAGMPQWIVDPIDGTVNFFHGLPFWCCSVAVQIAGRSVAGVVYAPEIDEIYTATAEGDALLNGARIHVSSTAPLSAAMLLTGLSRKDGPDAAHPDLIERLARATQKIRVLGSAALDMCRVARGHAESYWEPAIYIWDMAAAGLIVERAGGTTEILARDGHRVNFMATNGHVHAALRDLLPSRAKDF